MMGIDMPLLARSTTNHLPNIAHALPGALAAISSNWEAQQEGETKQEAA